MPPMPWQNYAKMTDADLQAVFAYLRTVPVVKNRVPDPIPPAGAAAQAGGGAPATGAGTGAGASEPATPPSR